MHIHITNRRERIAFNGRHRHQIRAFRFGTRNKTEQLRKPARMPREIRVWDILLATKPDLPTPEKKTVPLQLRSVRVKRLRRVGWSTCWNLAFGEGRSSRLGTVEASPLFRFGSISRERDLTGFNGCAAALLEMTGLSLDRYCYCRYVFRG
ncbi:hypothetical protein OIU78_021744 [Salix suchowensis]|nr:hypothetical protein OIU78_021744 [Salix suchowensis]